MEQGELTKEEGSRSSHSEEWSVLMDEQLLSNMEVKGLFCIVIFK